MPDEQEQQSALDTQIKIETNFKPITESLDTIELVIDEPDVQKPSEPVNENIPEIPVAAMMAGIGGAACGVINGVFESKGVDPLNKEESKALTNAIGGVMPYIAPPDMTPKQMAFSSLAIVMLGIVSTRMGQFKNTPPSKKKMPSKDNVTDMASYISAAENVE